jgi:hypothetical protein
MLELSTPQLEEHEREALSRGLTRAQHEHDVASAHIAASHGMVGSLRLLMEARSAGITAVAGGGQSLALALRTQETGIKGNGNVWGHDPTIFVGGRDKKHHHDYGPELTERAVREYLKDRGPRGEGGMQGAGPLQLTYWTFQDRAMRLGGLWVTRWNYQVGFEDLAHLIQVYRGHKNPVEMALAVYNGGATHPNHLYAASVLKHRDWWHEQLT